MRCARKAATVPNLRLGSWIQHGVANCVEFFEIDLQMESKIDPETMKIQAPRAVLEPSGDPLGDLGVSIDLSFASVLYVCICARTPFCMRFVQTRVHD